ncbi:hypothetical protein SARC_12889 [Sphaeroforma arctica JP610]|uniref:Uncharacterized protein n=1 Tax=Sphaeroforma arctica JP610 TaxID=667725 RepID=A0A0L0FCV3_9EUKA|nr:hypothetical protein SARC_12889 [Sphaeroforma arctica JP610]KNC74570.1 hypothetical protein SARC_12889 [Sphaeroforma arctica JP610]|eukprot:XP_014148472.1 hypothetical protein SARC_12889 [Sphaeroforma arctica JP610]
MWTKQDWLAVVLQTQVIEILESQAADEDQPKVLSPPAISAASVQAHFMDIEKRLDYLANAAELDDADEYVLPRLHDLLTEVDMPIGPTTVSPVKEVDPQAHLEFDQSQLRKLHKACGLPKRDLDTMIKDIQSVAYNAAAPTFMVFDDIHFRHGVE